MYFEEKKARKVTSICVLAANDVKKIVKKFSVCPRGAFLKHQLTIAGME
jgi:hypothetical protein